MAVGESARSPAGAWAVGLPVAVVDRDEPADAAGVASTSQQQAHLAHARVDVREEQRVAGAQVVQPGLSVPVVGESVLGASTVAGEPHRALQALPWQIVALGPAEGDLLRGRHQLEQRSIVDVSQQNSGSTKWSHE